MEPNFADDLLSAIDQKGSPVCVGIDPVYERLPAECRWEVRDEVERTEGINIFCMEVLKIVAPIVPAVKLQSAHFERYGSVGVDLYRLLVEFAHDLDLLVIGDVKRGDIGSTAEAYARGHLTGMFSPYGPTTGVPDAITVNPYLGVDGVRPFVELAAGEDRGLFVLVRTSNPSAKDVQDFAGADGRKLYEHVAEHVAEWGSAQELIGERGYSCVGAVVGATYPAEARRLREIMPQQIFLVPGYGAQGATAEDCAAAFKPDGTGAIVNASRSVIYAHESAGADRDWKKAIASAAGAFAEDIRRALTGKKS
ncbi:MAG TPA: orotidine-5'-phosphate decarboxylase [Phycisphaerae bacterium]|nr:orotidine-5'-phosphate decarboxylase [Phycisphaerae bacterium]